MSDKYQQTPPNRGPVIVSKQEASSGRSQITFWKDKSAKTIDPRLFSDQSNMMAQKLGKEHDEDKNKKLNKRTQIRKFYDEVVRLNGFAQTRDDQWQSVLPQVHMLVAKAAYARGRGLVSDNFLNFIKESVNQVETKEDLLVFADFFEAFMGFYRLYVPNN